MKALQAYLRLQAPEAIATLSYLAAYRDELGPESFAELLGQATVEADLAEAVTLALHPLATMPFDALSRLPQSGIEHAVALRRDLAQAYPLSSWQSWPRPCMCSRSTGPVWGSAKKRLIR